MNTGFRSEMLKYSILLIFYINTLYINRVENMTPRIIVALYTKQLSGKTL